MHVTSPSEMSRPGAIEPAYPLNQPGEPIPIYAGNIDLQDQQIGFQDQRADGVIELACTSDLQLTWRIRVPKFPIPGPVNLRISSAVGHHVISAFQSSNGRGWINEVEIFKSDGAPVRRVVAHWMNLPRLLDSATIRKPDSVSGVAATWRRWTHVVDGWRLTIDGRTDHSRVFDKLKDARTIAITHVMEIRREDEEDFSVSDVTRLLDALQFGLSFGLGRWVAPAIPVGFDSAGSRKWEHWAPLFCDGGANGASGKWLRIGLGVDLRHLIDRVVAAFADDWTTKHEWLPLLALAIRGNRDGLLEQRIMTLHVGLEMLIWVRLRHDLGWSKSRYERLKTHEKRLRAVLADAGVSTQIDAVHLARLHAFAQDALARDRANNNRDPNRPLITPDGAFAVCEIRNRVIHPEPQRPVGSADENTEHLREEALFDAFLLSQEYLILLLLHRLKYVGEYDSPIKEKPSAKVPWAVPS